MRRVIFVLAVAALLSLPSFAQTIDPGLGVDPRVDYTELDRLGPWDDRNYDVTSEDLQFLAPNEEDLRNNVPVFFRIEMRKAWPELQQTGPAQYPRSALQIFLLNYGGYLVDGKLYKNVERVNGRYRVSLENGVEYSESEGGATRVLSGEVKITSPNGAAESAVKINPVDTNIVIAGSNGPGSGQKMHYSTDGGASWTETTLPQGGTCCDPTVDWSSDGSLAYSSTLGSCGAGGCSIWVYRSDDGGVTWNGLENVTPGDPRRELTNGGSDKEFIHVDKHATSPFKDNLYVTWHDSNVMKFAVSSNSGNTFSQQAFSSLSGDRGIGSDITTDHTGAVYYLWPAFNSRTIKLTKSTDGGLNFGAISTVASTQGAFIFPIPSTDTREVFIYVSADTDLTGGGFHGRIYAAWTDSTAPTSSTPSANHARIQVAYSSNGGSSWNVSTPHETADSGSVDRWHQFLSVASDGSVHVVFYDTRRDPTRNSVDLFRSVSTDGAVTWSTPERVTAELSPRINNSFEFGDYNGLDAVMSDLIAVWTDNRFEGGGTGDSIDVYGAGFTATPSDCGNNLIEGGEMCDGTDLGGQTCGDFGCSGGTLACNVNCDGFDTSNCTGCPACNNNSVCDAGEDCNSCAADCPSGTTTGADCGNNVCEAGNGEDCVSCPADCNGKQNGKPSGRWCCGDGDGEGPVGCADARCDDNGNTCTTVPVSPGSFCCGDTTCESGETCANCALDCMTGPEVCGNGLDDDCNSLTDCLDTAVCGALPECQACTLLPLGASCSSNSECCSNKCKGPPGGKTCK